MVRIFTLENEPDDLLYISVYKVYLTPLAGSEREATIERYEGRLCCPAGHADPESFLADVLAKRAVKITLLEFLGREEINEFLGHASARARFDEDGFVWLQIGPAKRYDQVVMSCVLDKLVLIGWAKRSNQASTETNAQQLEIEWTNAGLSRIKEGSFWTNVSSDLQRLSLSLEADEIRLLFKLIQSERKKDHPSGEGNIF